MTKTYAFVSNKVTEELLLKNGFKYSDGLLEYRKNVYNNSIELVIRVWIEDENDHKCVDTNIMIIDKSNGSILYPYENNSEYMRTAMYNILDTLEYLRKKGIIIYIKKNEEYVHNGIFCLD